MSVWLTIPSARPAVEADPLLALWRERGYRIALWRDGHENNPDADLVIVGPYPGYAEAVNRLIRQLVVIDLQAEWFIAAGDDTEPEPNRHAEDIAQECAAYFSRLHFQRNSQHWRLSTYGVMQPTGDRWHEGVGGFQNAPIDRVCGSAWFGREYCTRMYRGQGPLFPGYLHMFEDEEAQEVAIKMGVLWQRRDLTQRHNHWGRGATEREIVEMHPGLIPEHLKKWNTGAHWNEAQALFRSRKAAGFPGHEPL